MSRSSASALLLLAAAVVTCRASEGEVTVAGTCTGATCKGDELGLRSLVSQAHDEEALLQASVRRAAVQTDARKVLPFGELLGTESDGIMQFRHVPFALQMTPARRFEATQDWTGEYPNREWNARVGEVPVTSCETVEDCLYLQIWAPSNKSGLPVLFWLYGGGFYKGSGNDESYDGSAVAAQDVVVVNTNYRLGSLGWLALPAQAAAGLPTGNFGLLDVQSALRWVQKHIHVFGGDSQRVTVYGRSAGAITVQQLLVAKGSKGLFSGAVVQSGHPEAKPLDVAISIQEDWAGLIGCLPATMECMRKATFDEVRAADYKLKKDPRFGGEKYRWFPTLDYVLIKDQPWRMIERGDFVRVPLGAGTVTDEGTLFSRYSSGWGPDFVMDAGELREAVSTYLEGMSIFYPKFKDPSLVDKILPHYSSLAEQHQDDLAPVYARFFGDIRYTCPMWHFAEEAASFVDVWRYRFDLRCYPGGKPPEYGVYHGAGIPFVFGHKESKGEPCSLTEAGSGRGLSAKDTLVLSQVNKDILHFVKAHRYPETWETFKAGSNNVVHHTEGPKVVSSEPTFRGGVCEFLGEYMWT